MPLHDITYLQELKKRLFLKINQEWNDKWSHFPKPYGNNYSDLPSLSAFTQELLDDIDLVLKEHFTLEERSNLLISKESLRRILENKQATRLQTHTRNCLVYYLGYDSWELFKEDVVIDVSFFENENDAAQEEIALPEESSSFFSTKVKIITISCIGVLLCVGLLALNYHNRQVREEELCTVIRRAAYLEFSLYRELPKIDTVLLAQLSACFSNKERSSYLRIIRTAKVHSLKSLTIRNKDNPSSYKIMEPIEVVRMNDENAELITREYWNLSWYDITRKSYTDKSILYDELNEQQYFMVKENGVWKIGINHYPNKSVQKSKH